MVLTPFCQSQVYAKGDSVKAFLCKADDPKAQLFCIAHLAEDQASPCPYNAADIYVEPSAENSPTTPPRKAIAHSKEGELVGRCEDFLPV